MVDTPRSQAVLLAEELLADIELSRLPPMDVIRKASRLARLLDDSEAMAWLACEVAGYRVGEEGKLDAEQFGFAMRSNRVGQDKDGEAKAIITPVGELQTNVEAGLKQLQAAIDPSVSISSANPQQWVAAPGSNASERSTIRAFVARQRGLLDRIMGAVHGYVAARFHELRFGSAVETAFEVVRRTVDAEIAALVPDALPMLAAAFENASSNNPEHWSNAAATCRRLLKAAADALRPPGPDVEDRKMGDENYVNRLVDWIQKQSPSRTVSDLVGADLEFLGRRFDAVLDAGHKGAHAQVSRFEASRFLTGTYLLLGDIIRLGRSPGDSQ